MKYRILNDINSPEDLRAVADKDIPDLCREIRDFLVEKVEASGGHLASNLGVTELSVALHRVFDSPRDHVIFDIGHQSYVHKILTGRKDRFDDLRTPGGLSGFTLMRESEHDAFGAGHSSTAISAALGYAEAAMLNGTNEHTVCIIGDGAFTGGMVHEALNNCRSELKLVIILNENGMAISGNRGNFAECFSEIDHRVELNRRHYFECLGLSYVGPIDGNDYHAVAAALEQARDLGKCTVVHIRTVKGKGFAPAESSPTEFHSVRSATEGDKTFHSIFADSLIKKAEKDEKILAVTAAMGAGTGLESFGERFPRRYFDVGIAETHALTFSAGLAAAGYKPHVAIYSTFLQRGYDNIIHDIALQNLPVCIMIDRAGLAPSDGATHHGIFDVAFLSHIPEMEIYAPASFEALSRLVDADNSKPTAIRYPNASELDFVDKEFGEIPEGEMPLVRADFTSGTSKKLVFITYGNILAEVHRAKTALSARGIDTGIILVEKIKPYADSCNQIYDLVSSSDHVVYVEEGIKNGGAAMITGNTLTEMGIDTSKTTYDIIAIDDNFAAPEQITDIYDYVGLSAEKILARCEDIINRP